MRMTSEFIIVPIKNIHKFDTLRPTFFLPFQVQRPVQASLQPLIFIWYMISLL